MLRLVLISALALSSVACAQTTANAAAVEPVSHAALPQSINPYMIAVAPYRDNKRGAVSYSFDDGPPSSFAIAQMFEDRNLRASFNIIPDNVATADWPRWKELAARGHEIGNHTMAHIDLSDTTLNRATLDYQINAAQEVIYRNTGVKPIVFVYPFNRPSQQSLDVALENHIATRYPGFQYDRTGYHLYNIGSKTTLEQLDSALAVSYTKGAWLVAAGHGIDGDGWSPVDSGILAAHLDHALTQYPELWIDTFAHVAKYQLCRERSFIEAAVTPTGGVTVSLMVPSSGPLQCDEALTMVVRITDALSGPVQASSNTGRQVSVMQRHSEMYFDEYAGEQVDLELAP